MRNDEKNMKNRMKIIIIVVILCISVTAVTAVWIVKAGEMPYLVIDNRTVTKEEYQQALKDVRYDVNVYFSSTYGAIEEENFWTGEYGGEVPYKKLADEAVERLKYLHAVYSVAEENGDIDDPGYDSLVERMKNENRQRKEKIENGEVVYGLSEYSLEQFMEYEISSFKERYCSDETNEGMKLTEDEIRERYESRDWIVGRDAEKADLETVRVNVETELREENYDKMIRQRAADSNVETYWEKLYSFTLKSIKK